MHINSFSKSILALKKESVLEKDFVNFSNSCKEFSNSVINNCSKLDQKSREFILKESANIEEVLDLNDLHIFRAKTARNSCSFLRTKELIKLENAEVFSSILNPSMISVKSKTKMKVYNV